MTKTLEDFDYQTVLAALEERLAGRWDIKIDVARSLASKGRSAAEIHFLMRGFFSLTEVVAFIAEAEAGQ